MWNLLTYISESLICGAILFLLYHLVVRRERSYQFHRLFILASIASIAVFPLIEIPFGFSSPLDLRHYLEPAITTAEGSAGEADESFIIDSRKLGIAINYIYIIIASVYLVFISLHLIKLKWLYTNATRAGFGKYTIVCSKKVEVPFSFINTIFIGDNLAESDRDYVIKHEFSHISRGHSLDILIVNAVNIFQWFNPFIYLFKHALVETHEYQADRDVLTCGGSLVDYRKLLLNTQFGVSPYLSNSLNKSLTLKRFRKMENLEQKRAGFKAVSATLLSLLILFTMVSFNSANGTSLSNQSNEDPSNQKMIDRISESELSDTTKKEVPFMMVEEKPKFMDGDETKFTMWVAERLVYPASAKADTVQGRVIMQFKIDEKGNLGSVKVIRGVDPRLDSEAVRVVSLSPAWTPGKHKGKSVSVVYVFPVIFKLR